MPKRKIIFRGVVVLLSVLSSCSVEKNTSLSRNYHSLISHYNIYFNGRESYKKGLDRARTELNFDYSRNLPLFLYELEESQSLVSGDMKRAIDKATKAITFHSITAKPKVKEGRQSAADQAFFDRNEYNKWVDDSFILMGSAYMHQGEFYLAGETFKHVLVTFPHDDIRFLGMIWLARANLMNGEAGDCERILTTLSGEEALPGEFRLDYELTWTALSLKRGAYAKGAEYLSSALERRGIDKEDRIRWTYLLAQLYEVTGDKSRALEAFRQVNSYNPSYEMAFNARVSMAEVFESTDQGSDDLKKLLTKMLRDSKNKEYLDQIYFALGNLAREEGDLPEAIDLYQKSVSASVQNRNQKGISSLTLAKIYYDRPDYMLSAAYYDSAVSFLREDHPGYRNLMTLSASLNDLVYQVTTFETEDSLQHLAALPEEERLAVVDAIIAELREKEEEARAAEQEALQDMAYNQNTYLNNSQGSATASTGGQWYFYNLNAKSSGQPEFRMKWGERRLEDNWRRKNRQSAASLLPGTESGSDSLAAPGGRSLLDNKTREFYLAAIPLSDSAMKVSNARMEEALFHMGEIYKGKLLDYREAIGAYTKLMERFPGTERAPGVLYALYELYNSTQDPDRAGRSKDKLVREYPDTHYAKLLSNPNYLKELEAEEMKVVRHYESVYEDYRRGRHGEVIRKSDQALALYPGDRLEPKFLYIRALSEGSLRGKEALKAGLDSLIARYPDTEEGIQATETVAYLYMEFPEIQQAEQEQRAEELYTSFDPSQEHYFLLVLLKQANVNQVSFDLLNYNLDHFNQYNLEIDRLTLEDASQVLVVKLFNNARTATRYLDAIRGAGDQVVKNLEPSLYRMMVISRDNLEILSRDKHQEPYFLFYQNQYDTPD
ncbi:MAG: tetratricopeptide repeat protein [Bacteroidales bacterium]